MQSTYKKVMYRKYLQKLLEELRPVDILLFKSIQSMIK